MNIKLLVIDVDGVLTDGGVVIDACGGESKVFNVRDGAGIYMALGVGIGVVWLSGRYSEATLRRAAELGVGGVYHVSRDKLHVYEKIKGNMELLDSEIAYIGDDVLDIPPMLRCGLPMAPSDAVYEVRRIAKYVSKFGGGKGCVRDCIEYVLKGMGLFDSVIGSYSNMTP